MTEEERMQVKCNYDDETMHIQCVSNNVQRGREYGMAIKLPTTTDISMWLREQTPTLVSAASGGAPMYTPFSLYKYSNGEIQMFVPGNKLNHEQGAVMNLHPLCGKVKKLLGFADEAGFIQDAEGVPYTTGGDTDE